MVAYKWSRFNDCVGEVAQNVHVELPRLKVDLQKVNLEALGGLAFGSEWA
jgi:hypothetical protein